MAYKYSCTCCTHQYQFIIEFLYDDEIFTLLFILWRCSFLVILENKIVSQKGHGCVPPTGKSIKFAGISILRDGKCEGRWKEEQF